jgi:hypothetical protein
MPKPWSCVVSLSAALLAACSGGGDGGLFSDPDTLAIVKTVAANGMAFGVALDGKGHAFVNDAYGITVVDIKDGFNADSVAMLASAPMVSTITSSILHAGNHVYSAHGTRVDVIDVSDPAAPANVAQLPGTGQILALSLAGSLLYVADEFSGVSAYDVGNPAAPTLVGTVLPGAAYAVVATASHVYVGQQAAIAVVERSSGGAYQMVGSLATSTRHGLALLDGYLYSPLYDGTYLDVIDVHTPSDPQLRTNFTVRSLAGNPAYGARVVGNRLLVAGTMFVDVFDLGNRAEPTRLGGVPFGGTDAAADGKHVYAATGAGLNLLGKPAP